MAQRRMFSNRVIGSAKFIKMPLSSQALYFHLGISADDDGIVEAYPIMKTLGATEDDLRVLIAKNFVIILNEDLVAYITDWHENNKIRADRKVDSIYKDLLIQVVPEVEIQQAKPRADTKKLTGGQPLDVQWTTNGQPMDGIGKDSIGKDIYSANELFEKVWKLYPRKKGKSQISDTTKKKLLKVGEEALVKAIERYKKEVAGKEEQYILNGSTFFNGRYQDYLDENYEEPEEHKTPTFDEWLANE